MSELLELLDRLTPQGQHVKATCHWCGATVFDYDLVPDLATPWQWHLLAAAHGPDCEWVRTKAFQITPNQEVEP